MDKELYRKNRESGLRGQGPYPNLVTAIDTTPPSTARGLGLRKRPSRTKHSKFNTPSWAKAKAAIRERVERHEAVAKSKAAARRAARTIK